MLIKNHADAANIYSGRKTKGLGRKIGIGMIFMRHDEKTGNYILGEVTRKYAQDPVTKHWSLEPKELWDFKPFAEVRKTKIILFGLVAPRYTEKLFGIWYARPTSIKQSGMIWYPKYEANVQGELPLEIRDGAITKITKPKT